MYTCVHVNVCRCQVICHVTKVKMLQSAAVKASAPAAASAHAAGAGAGGGGASVMTDPTLRLMAAAAAAAGGRPGRPSDVTVPRPSAAAAAHELYASLLYSHQHQMDRAALMMHHGPFSPAVVSASSVPRGQQQQQQQQLTGAGPQPPQAHTGGFTLPPYQPSSHPHQMHAPGPAAAAAAFESYSQSLATLSQLSQRLQLHAGPHSTLPTGPPTAPLSVDPYLAAAAAAAAHGVGAGSPACKRQMRSPTSRAAVNDSQVTPRNAGRHANLYEFSDDTDVPPDVRYKHDDLKEHGRHRHHHHHHHHHGSQQQQQQLRKPAVAPSDVMCRDENHNAFNALQRAATTHTPLHPPPATPTGNDVISESPEVSAGDKCSAVGRAARRADFTHGSMIQLSDGRVKRIQDMLTEDFAIKPTGPVSGRGGVTSSQQLVLVSSRVVHIRLNHDTCTAVLGFVVDNNLHAPVHAVDRTRFLRDFSSYGSFTPIRRRAASRGNVIQRMRQRVGERVDVRCRAGHRTSTQRTPSQLPSKKTLLLYDAIHNACYLTVQ